MKSAVKKVLCAAIMILMLVSCSADVKTPSGALDSFLSSYQKNDYKTMRECVVYESEPEIDDITEHYLDAEDFDDIFKNLIDDMTYSFEEIENQPRTVTYEVKFSIPDAHYIFEKAPEIGLANYVAPVETEDNPVDLEAEQQKVMKLVITAMKELSISDEVALYETTMNVSVSEYGGEWGGRLEEEMLNALTANLYAATN